MIIVSNKLNGGYNGRFVERARDLVVSGTRVGMMHVGPEPNPVYCHVCQSHFPKPVKPQAFNDDFGECPNCHTPFVFNWV